MAWSLAVATALREETEGSDQLYMLRSRLLAEIELLDRLSREATTYRARSSVDANTGRRVTLLSCIGMRQRTATAGRVAERNGQNQFTRQEALDGILWRPRHVITMAEEACGQIPYIYMQYYMTYSIAILMARCSICSP